MTRYDPVSEAEAAELGRALLDQLKGNALSDARRALLARASSQLPEDQRVGAPVVEESETLLVLPRGESAQLRVDVRRFRGSSPFLDLRRWERGTKGFHPTRQGVTIRSHELGRLWEALAGALRRAEAGPEK